MTSLGSVLKAAIIAGLLAGAAAAGFHSLLIEPLIDRAIQVEERLGQERGEVAKEPLVSRQTQRLGLVVGLLLYGATWGLLFGVVFNFTRGWQPAAWSPSRRGLLLAALASWSVAVFPFLKYPANPPGVGDPMTIGYRQVLYWGFIGLSVMGTAFAVGLNRLLNRLARSSALGRVSWLLALTLYALYSAGVYGALPGNPDAVRMPAQLVWTFRVISLAGLVLFWGVLGAMFGWLSRERGSQVVERSSVW